jgi:hypothetical protein
LISSRLHQKDYPSVANNNSTLAERRHETQHNDIQHKDTQHNGLLCDTQHTDSTKSLSMECH